MGKRIKSEKKGGGGGKESKFIEEYAPLTKNTGMLHYTLLGAVTHDEACDLC